jgi:hypothetical protein
MKTNLKRGINLAHLASGVLRADCPAHLGVALWQEVLWSKKALKSGNQSGNDWVHLNGIKSKI